MSGYEISKIVEVIAILISYESGKYVGSKLINYFKNKMGISVDKHKI